MAPPKTWLSAIGLCLISSVAATRLRTTTLHSPARYSKFNKPASHVRIGKVEGISRRQDEGCHGTCAECFGSNFRSCPDNENLCWDPNDPTTGCDEITIPDVDDIDIPDFDDIDIPGGTEWCTSGETCSECFGPSFELCPGSSNMCWDPNDFTSTCELDGGIPDDDDDDIDIPGGTEWCTSGETCTECFGPSFELCPGTTNMCWDPSDFTSTCELDGGIPDDEEDDPVDDDNDSVDDDDLPTDSVGDEPSRPPTTPSPTDDEESTSPTPSPTGDEESASPTPSGSSNDDGPGQDGGDDGSGSEGEVPDQDDSAAVRIGGMDILAVVAGAVGVVALL